MNPSPESAKSVLVGETTVLGTSKDLITLAEIQSISCDITTQAHLIRHFRSLPDLYLEEIRGKDFMRYDMRVGHHVPATLNDSIISELLQTSGSKFLQDLPGYRTPKDVFDKAVGHCLDSVSGRVSWIDKGSRDVAYFVMTVSHSIGTQNVVDLNSAPTEIRDGVFRKTRGAGGDEIEINFVVMEPPETNLMVIMLQRTETGCRLETAYPGMVVTDLPQPARHNRAELSLTQSAWANLAFVEPPNSDHLQA